MCDAKFCGSPLDKLRHLAAANRMFVREKRINGYAYLYLVETVREGGRARQRIIKNLGRKEAVTASGALERLATSVARYAERALVRGVGNPRKGEALRNPRRDLGLRGKISPARRSYP